jgi:hypothetical protein
VGLFSHAPCEHVTVWPGAAVPEIDGVEVLTGTRAAGGATGVTIALTAGRLLPAELDATTVQVMAWLTSPEAIVYWLELCPEMFVPSRCQEYA